MLSFKLHNSPKVTKMVTGRVWIWIQNYLTSKTMHFSLEFLNWILLVYHQRLINQIKTPSLFLISTHHLERNRPLRTWYSWEKMFDKKNEISKAPENLALHRGSKTWDPQVPGELTQMPQEWGRWRSVSGKWDSLELWRWSYISSPIQSQTLPRPNI